MSGLRARLMIGLVAASLIGFSFTSLSLFAWIHKQVLYQKRVELQTAALQALAFTREKAFDNAVLLPNLKSVVEPYHVDITLLAPENKNYEVDGMVHVQKNLEYVAVRTSLSTKEPILLISRSWPKTMQSVYRNDSFILLVLGLGFSVMAFIAYIFLRRSVLQPLQRMSLRLQQGELSSFEQENIDDFARIGHGIVHMAQKISDDKAKIEDQLFALQTAHQALELTSKQLIRSERLAAVGKLSASLAHEIGNPLAVLTGYAELLHNKKLPLEEFDNVIVNMQKELLRLQHTIKQLLDFSRSGGNQKEGNIQEAVLHLKSLLVMHPKIKQLNVTLPSVAPLAIQMDTRALVQVLFNLVLNAADAIASEEGRIIVAAIVEQDKIIISVEDSGTGISKEILPRLFEPFFTTKSGKEGNGLGLAICERIVSSSGGEIWAENSADLPGAKFSFTVLLSAVQRQAG